MKIAAIYDNGGKTLDRYTVVTDCASINPYERDMLGVSKHGTGFSQWGTGQFYDDDMRRNRHLGKIVHFEQLNSDLQAHIADRVFSL